ncbi:cytochrome p450 [Hirsutella rhossiliensis]|uniref:Cytochrome p450 domain-containing protein n=1 Tax=Hirsutella rhossiliensis TaxID=111463 RepID=A0A9P8N2G4_9HYPO|nr:cytochrome p450 domain-containing protein [Hirsutella rhossiliensis]KAH0965634.1 cytochrome p450 domain-containing protein [Hirsutella rhossiliensis]
MPKAYPWKQFQQWSKIYGDIFSLQIGQMTIIVLGTHQVAKDLLSKRAVIYNSRPRLVMAAECVKKNFGAALLPYSETWRQRHKIQMTFLNTRKCCLYKPLQHLESCHLLFNLLSTNDFETELHRYSTSLILTLLYGRRIVTGQEPELEQIEQLLSEILQSASFGNWLVDVFPLFNVLPRMLAKWKRIGDDLHQRQSELYEGSLEGAVKAAPWNWSKQSYLIDKPPVSSKELAFVLGDIYEAGSHTTTVSLIVAILACVSHPEAMRRVQKELDERVGTTCLPSLDDAPSLPYTRSFVEEVLRWRTLAPQGVPHSPLRDDVYNGYLIPKGATVISNQWSFNMDEKVFSSPDDFQPERWMDHADLPLAAFGFGKRTCPGQHLARSSLMLVISRLLWAFDITWKQGQGKQPAQIDIRQEGIAVRPCSFGAEFKVRSSVHEKLIRAEWKISMAENLSDLLNGIGQRFAET